MIKKQFYTAPEAESPEIRFEENVCTPTNQGGGGQYGDDDTHDNGGY